MSAQVSVQQSTIREPEGAPLRVLAALDRVGESIARHDKPNHDDLLRISVDPRRFLEAISDAVKDAVYNFVVGKTIDKEFLNRKGFDQRFVAHGPSPKQKTVFGFCWEQCAPVTGSLQAKRENNRRGVASCSELEHSRTPCFVGFSESLRLYTELRERHCSDREFSASAHSASNHASVAASRFVINRSIRMRAA
jgi:hypothetical protein